MQRRMWWISAAALMALAVACGGDAQKGAPTSPSAVGVAGGAAAADDATLKVNGPTLVTPAANEPLMEFRPTLTIAAATGKYAQAQFTYRIQVYESSGELFWETTGTVLSYKLGKDLGIDKSYTWRARAEYDGAVGAWTSSRTFLSPSIPRGYLLDLGERGSEIWDPLTDGTTVGEVSGPVQWIAGQGVKLLEFQSRITYHLPSTLQDGEFSIMVTGMDEGSPGDKSKVMSMQEGDGPITDNDYRFTVEKRAASYPTPGVIAFRIITGDSGSEDQVHDGQRREPIGGMSDSLWYFWKARWTLNIASVEVREEGTTGRLIYFEDTDYDHPYRPTPHVVHLGAPPSRAGWQDATVPGMIIKNVWVSPNPRPAWADITAPSIR